ncbi:bacteriophage abortive infection AbiH family protein [Vagococcus sp. PNs007]|uniref:Bacteriophage abortive infection AbiH family protein n=1 Tax=Vagococcus proximus TaxID=2991417 RepID=A0ABT5X481_9ENTE|nr:AbiH family protein [Vagococcus proximus]MDF0480805.1 bacteriophage abortive infection AbiH family protein [Vagococcus proximus]
MVSEDKVLLIIGNGFDIAAGLKSSFQDFFNQRITTDFVEIMERHSGEFKRKNRIFRIGTLDSDYTVWDFYFYSKHLNANEVNWCDVEGNIKNGLVSKNRKNLLYDFIKRKTGYVSEGQSNLPASLLGSLARAYIFKDEKIFNNEREVYQFLKEELKKLEEAFIIYLKKQVSENSKYQYNALRQLRYLAGKKEYHLLSFNYTNPIEYKSDTVVIEQVHGSLIDNDIIFGIDQEQIDIEENIEIYKFSKTYRKLSQLKKHTEILNPDITHIKFYGHSLSEMDYSYFQSIFDYYDLYNSNVELIFYYSVYDKKKESEIVETQFEAVSKLIDTYGKSMTNINHGKNLMHKLILTNRLSILPFDVDREEIRQTYGD